MPASSIDVHPLGTSATEAPRLVFVVTGLGGGGAENALLNLCRYVLSRWADARIMVVCLLASDDGQIAEELRRGGIAVVSVQGVFRRREFLPLARAMLQLAFLRPHLVQGWMYHGNVAAWLLRNLFSPCSPLVGSVHSLWSEPKHVSVVLDIARTLNLIGAALDFDHTLYAGNASYRQHVMAGFPRALSSVLPNGVYLPADDWAERTQDCSPVPVLVHVSRVHLDKDNMNFVRTVAALEARGFRCELVVLGTGLDADFMHRALPGYRDFRSVKVACYGFRTDVVSFLRRASLMFLTSKSEAFPVSLVEALGAGAVCVATDVGDCSAIIGDCGTTVPPGDSERLAEALITWGTESHRHREAWATRCRARADRHFSLAAMGQMYARFFAPSLMPQVI